jgi:hypothetical protein
MIVAVGEAGIEGRQYSKVNREARFNQATDLTKAS